MWGFIESNWQTVLLMAVLLLCPLMHAFGHGRGSHRHTDGKAHR